MSQQFSPGGQGFQSQHQSFQRVFRVDFLRLTDLTDLILLLSKGLSRVFSSTKVWKASILWHSAFFTVQPSHPYMTTGKTIALTMWTFVSKVRSLIFNTLSRFEIILMYV